MLPVPSGGPCDIPLAAIFTPHASGSCKVFSIHANFGEYLAITLALISASGSGPNILESLDQGKLSPTTQQ